MFTSFGHVVFLIKATQQFLKHRTHGVVVECRQFDVSFIIKDRLVGQVDLVVSEFFYDAAQSFSLGQVIHHLPEVKLVKNILHVMAESVEVVDEVHFQAQWVGLTLQSLHGEQ